MRSMRINKKLFLAPGIAVLCLGLVARSAEDREGHAVAAPSSPTVVAGSNQDLKNELRLFGDFLDRNPNIDARFRENTALIDDPAFIKNHPQFSSFLEQHPNIQAALKSDPRWFIHREYIRQFALSDSTEPPAEFDRLLDQNPDLEKQLAQDPQLLSKPEFLNSHAALQAYVDHHAVVQNTGAPRANNQPKATAPVSPGNHVGKPPVRVRGRH